jgi:hypothetical protein
VARKPAKANKPAATQKPAPKEEGYKMQTAKKKMARPSPSPASKEEEEKEDSSSGKEEQYSSGEEQETPVRPQKSKKGKTKDSPSEMASMVFQHLTPPSTF